MTDRIRPEGAGTPRLDKWMTKEDESMDPGGNRGGSRPPPGGSTQNQLISTRVILDGAGSGDTTTSSTGETETEKFNSQGSGGSDGTKYSEKQ